MFVLIRSDPVRQKLVSEGRLLLLTGTSNESAVDQSAASTDTQQKTKSETISEGVSVPVKVFL